MRDPLSIANVDCLLDTVTALVADCDHESIKRLKNIEAYTSRCKYFMLNINYNNRNCFNYHDFQMKIWPAPFVICA